MGFWETILVNNFVKWLSYWWNWWKRRREIKVTFINWRNHFHKKDGKLIQFNPESANINEIQKYSFDSKFNIISRKQKTTEIIDPRISFTERTGSAGIDKGLFLFQHCLYDNKKTLARVITIPPNELINLNGYGEIDRDYTDLNFNAVIKSKVIMLIGRLRNKKTFHKTIKIGFRPVTPSSRQPKFEDN